MILDFFRWVRPHFVPTAEDFSPQMMAKILDMTAQDLDRLLERSTPQSHESGFGMSIPGQVVEIHEQAFGWATTEAAHRSAPRLTPPVQLSSAAAWSSLVPRFTPQR